MAKISPEVYQEVKPYLLPSEHPAKKKLDKIFSRPSVILDEKHMVQSGFINPTPRKFTRLVVTRHPDLEGYVIKTYLDSQRYYKNKPEHKLWLMRIEGVRKIAQVIQEYGLQEYFKVPKKWIYEIPNKKTSKNYLTKHYILIEEDMNLLTEKENLKMWKSSAISQIQLQSLYIILSKVGLRDCATPDNIPLSYDGRIAFIDTQTHGAKVPYNDLLPYLSRTNKKFWQEISKK